VVGGERNNVSWAERGGTHGVWGWSGGEREREKGFVGKEIWVCLFGLAA